TPGVEVPGRGLSRERDRSMAARSGADHLHPAFSPAFLRCGDFQRRSSVDAVPRSQEQAMAKTKPFVSDIENIRKRARQDIDKGAMTAGYRADRATVVKLLNHALATEIVCVLRYKYHYYMASGIHSQAIKAEFLQHANEEQGHADLIAERITQLDGKPNLSPDGLATRSHADYVEGEDIVDMADPTTRRMLEGILAMEEEHAEDMNTLLEQLGKKGEPARPAPAHGKKK